MKKLGLIFIIVLMILPIVLATSNSTCIVKNGKPYCTEEPSINPIEKLQTLYNQNPFLFIVISLFTASIIYLAVDWLRKNRKSHEILSMIFIIALIVLIAMIAYYLVVG